MQGRQLYLQVEEFEQTEDEEVENQRSLEGCAL
jgi:hypothetical protein